MINDDHLSCIWQIMTTKLLSRATRYDNFPWSVDIQIVKPGHVETVVLLSRENKYEVWKSLK